MAPESRKSAAQKTQSQGASRAWEALTPALSEWILEAVSAMGFLRMTPVQASTIPLFIGAKDVVVEAVTGSGKTLAFLIPVVQRLLRLEEPIRKHHVGAIIISPTRELATQIHAVLLSLLAFHAPSSAAIVSARASGPHNSGDPVLDSFNTDTATTVFPSSTLKVLPQLLLGGSTTPQQDLAQFLSHSPNLLISTPGRLLELLSSPHVHCPQSSFEVLVLDEADRLLDLGFKDDLQKILQRLPKQRRTGLFSASVSEAVDQLVRVGLRNPVKIAVKVRGVAGQEEQRTPASLQMTYLTTTPTQRLPALLTLLRTLSPQPQKSIAYLSTCAAVDHFSHLLTTLLASPLFPSHQLTIIPLHGKHTAAIRQNNYSRFLTTPTPTLLLTTDLAARGLDIPAVDLTLQLDPPSDPKTFLHRAGRAGRAGRKGLSIAFLLPGRETENYPDFLAVRKTPVTELMSTLSANEGATTVLTGILTNPAVAAKATAALRAAATKDRAIHDRAQRAFVSWVRSYRAHAAASIFRITDIEWVAQAEGWGLLRLPKMPELKMTRTPKADASDIDMEDRAEAKGKGKEAIIDRTLGLTVNWETYAYASAAQENKRLAELAAAKMNPAPPTSTGPRKPSAWSSNMERKETAVARRARKAAKRSAAEFAALDEEGRKERAEVEALVGRVREKLREEVEDEFVGFD